MGCNNSTATSGPKDGETNGQAGEGKAVVSASDKREAKKKNQDFEQAMMFMKKVPLLKGLPVDQHPVLAQNFEPVSYKAGATIISQGALGDAFYLIQVGSAIVENVKEDGTKEKLATLKAGDYFGENALLRDEPRGATITALSDSTCLMITRTKFKELNLPDKLQFANRRAVGAGGMANQATKAAKPPSQKTGPEMELIKKALKLNVNLSTIVSLDERRLDGFVSVMWKEDVKAGSVLIQEGDLHADYFYVVQDGEFEVRVTETEAEGTTGDKFGQVVSTVQAGGSFGELALLYLAPRAASVKAIKDSQVWVIDRTNFKEIMMKVSDDKLKEYRKYLAQVNTLSSLLEEELDALTKALVEMHFKKDEEIVVQGEPGNTFYILYDGEVDVIKDATIVSKVKADMNKHVSHVFGEGALLKNESRAATIKVASATAKTLVLDRDSFDLLLGPLADILNAKALEGNSRPSMVGRGSASAGAPTPPPKSRDHIYRKDLTRIGLLGCGGFGAVELYEHRDTKECYAMKSLSKGYIMKTNMQASVMNEKNILLMTSSPFVIALYETYNGMQTLYFLMEPAMGGELYATYNRKGFHGSDKHAKFYLAGTVFAFEHLHERRIIYRDLKPENLLLTEMGRIKLTDMGLAKFVIGKTYTTCGTPDYFAPELISSSGHTNAVDWWTLGILLFELLSGHPPFESAYPMQIYAKVMKGIGKVNFPPKCGGVAGDLIKGLLCHDPSQRLPMRPGGTKNIKTHAFFGGFDWGAMENLTMEVPYKPVVKSKKDMANFSARKEDMPKQLEYNDPGTGWDKDFATVKG